MFHFQELNGFLYVGDFLYIAALATIILKLQLEKSSQGFSAKTQGVYGVVLCTRNIDLLFDQVSNVDIIYSICKKIINISCIIYIVFKIKKLSKNDSTCSCNQDSFWVEALVLPCIVVTAALQYGGSPEEVLWSFSTYLEMVAMLPQLYLIHVRGKGDSYLPAYIALMATYSFADALAYCLNAFIYRNMPVVWPICKCTQLAFYIWYIIIPREAVLPVANCEERRRKTTMFMRQQSMLAQTLLQKNNSSADLQVFVLPSSQSSASLSECSTPSQSSMEYSCGSPGCCGNTPPASPCIKFDPAFEAESFHLKAPKLTLKPLKNKGSLQLNSLPASPISSRRIEFLKSSATVASFRSLSESVEENMDSLSKLKMSRVRRMGVSLPSSPESNRRMELPLKSAAKVKSHAYKSKFNPHSVKMRKYHFPRSNISLPGTPESVRKSELILKAPSREFYRSLSHMPVSYNYPVRSSRSPLPSSLLISTLADNKSDINSPLSSESTHTQTSFSSPKPERPPPPKLKESRPSTPLSEKKSQDCSNPTFTVSAVRTSRKVKPARPPLPKLILSTPEVVAETIQKF